MWEFLTGFIPKLLAPIASLCFLMSCSAIDETIHPDEKSSSPPRLTYEQVLKQNYKGPKARAAVVKFTDRSSGKETSQVGEGMAEMLCDALVATKRYIVQMRKSSDDVIKSQVVREGGRFNREEEIHLLIEGVIREFNPGIPGAGDNTGGASYVTINVTVTDPRANQMLATEKMRGKASNFTGTSGKRGALPDVFKDFSKTPMEKAIRIAVEESASFIVAKTPPESYRILPAPPREVAKPTPVTPKVVSPPPPPPPPLPTTQVVWDSVNLRNGPGTTYKIVGNVKKGTSLKILEGNGGWLRVRLDDGRTAWVSKLATSEAPKASSPPPPPPPPPQQQPQRPTPPPTASIQPAPM